MIDQQTNVTDSEARLIGDVIDAIGRSDIDEAFRLADIAIRGGALSPALFNARAMWFQQHARFVEAIADFECARAFFPHDPALLHAIASCLFQLKQNHRALSVVDLAIAADPANPAMHYLRGFILESISETEAARRAWERTLALKPDHLDAIMRLAFIMSQKGQKAEAGELALRALELDPGLPDAILLLAKIDSEEGRNTEVIDRVRENLGNPRFDGSNRLDALGLLADALDRQNLPNEAFDIYETINEERRSQTAHQFAVGRAVDNVLGLGNYFERSNSWPQSPPGAPHTLAPARHVFVLGFMRSGTSLLASVLASSPEVVAIDERDFLFEAARSFLGGDDNVDRLAGLGEEEIERWRSHYWQAVYKAAGPIGGKLFLDKMPFNTINLPLIARFFPDSRLLVAIRDPRDVVLSAYRNRFALHLDSFEFLRLADCARYYSAVMRLADLGFGKLPLTHLEHRYEDMIEDFEGSVRKLCGFVGIEWTDSMRDFRQGMTAINIRSVSAPQLQRGFYRDAVGQWRRYREQLAPVLPILQPWIEKFGYPLD